MPSRRHRPHNAAKLAKRRAQRARRRDREAKQASVERAALLADLAGIRRLDSERAAAAFERIFGDSPPPPEWSQNLFEDLGSARARALADAALQGTRSPGALALAADVALFLDGDAAAAERNVDEALQQLDDPFLGIRKAQALAERGQLAHAAETMGGVLALDPELQEAQLLRGRWLAQLADLERTSPPACSCGSGRAYEACCASLARALLARFRDRQPLNELHEAAYRYADSRPDLQRAVFSGLDEWVEQGAAAREEVDGWIEGRDDAPGAEALQLAVQRAWSLPLGEPDRSLIDELRADVSTAPHLARMAEDWSLGVAWGLWQVTELGDPGVLLTNVVTGGQLYAEFPAEMGDGLLPWSVLVGYFAPIEGIWRAGTAFYQTGPEQARPLAGAVLAATELVARKTHDADLEDWAHTARTEVEQASRLPEAGPPLDPGWSRTVASVCCTIFPQLVAELRRERAGPPQVVNTDGEPMQWIEAELHVRDPQGAFRALLEHPDFEEREDEGGIDWLGARVPRAEHEQSLAQLRSQGLEPPEDSEPGRYSRGTLRFDGSTVAVQVNSRGRFERLLALFVELGHPAEIVSDDVTDVMAELQQRMTWLPPGDPAPHADEADEAWLRSLPDEPLPALDGMTPREAAESAQYRDRLELFARDIEYRLASRGSSITGELLRERLGLS